MSSGTSHERSEFRVVYPLAARPRLTVAGQIFPVVDVSEHGARVLDDAATDMQLGARMEGTIALAHGPATAVRGVIVRRFADGFAIAFDEDAHILMAHIIGEQRHLRAHFPAWR